MTSSDRPRVLVLLACGALLASPARMPAQTLQQIAIPEVKEDAESYAQLFVDGNVKSVISQPSDVTTATGTVGLRYIGKTYIATGVISVGAKVDTLRRAFGATMLTPGSGGALNAGLLDIRRRTLWWKDRDCEQDSTSTWCNVGFHGYLTIGSSRWATNIDTIPPQAPEDGVAAGDTTFRVTGTVDVPTWGGGVGIYYKFFSFSLTEDDSTAGNPSTRNSTGEPQFAAMLLDFGLTSRHLRGDLYDDDPLRRQLVGTSRRDFYGVELGLGLQYKEVKAGLVYYYLDGHVKGLSKGQVAAGVSIQATLDRIPHRK